MFIDVCPGTIIPDTLGIIAALRLMSQYRGICINPHANPLYCPTLLPMQGGMTLIGA